MAFALQLQDVLAVSGGFSFWGEDIVPRLRVNYLSQSTGKLKPVFFSLKKCVNERRLDERRHFSVLVFSRKKLLNLVEHLFPKE